MLKTLRVSHGRSPETVVIAVFDMSSVHPLGGDFAAECTNLNLFTHWQRPHTLKNNLSQEP